MKKLAIPLLLLVCTASLLANFLLYTKANAYHNLVAVSWGDSKYAPALYGAYVYYEPDGDHLQVRATIYIDRPTLWQSYQHKTINLGQVRSDAEAVAQWGKITWSQDGVRFGTDERNVLIGTADLEKHR